MSQLYTEIMKDDQLKRAVLVEFGFGEVNKSKVSKWVKEKFPVEFAKIKKNVPSKKVLKFESNETETTTREERDAFLDNVTKKMDDINSRKIVRLYEEDYKELLELLALEEIENEGLTELIYTFISQNNLYVQFYEFLKANKEKFHCDVEHLMLDYQNEGD